MGEKPTWKEIDKMKESGTGRGTKKTMNDDRKSKSSKAGLDKLFSSGKLGNFIRSKEDELEIESTSDEAILNRAKKALRIVEHEKFLDEAELIVASDGAPHDFDFLARALALRQFDQVIMVMEKIKEMLSDDQIPVRSKAMKAQIKMVPFKFGDPQMDTLSSDILRLL